MCRFSFRAGFHFSAMYVSQDQSGKLPPRPTWDRTISGLLGIHFSMSVIACFHQLSVSAPVNIPHFSEPLGRAGSRVNQFWGFALQRVNFENVTAFLPIPLI